MRDSPLRFAVAQPTDCDSTRRQEVPTWTLNLRFCGMFAHVAWLLLATGCAVGTLDPSAEPCPCDDGFTCDRSTERCFLESDIRASTPPPARVRRDGGTGVAPDPRAPDPTGYDGGAEGFDARVTDAGDFPLDASVKDSGSVALPDAGGPEPDAGDAGAGEGNNIPHPATACFSSAAALSQCGRSSDGINTTLWSHTCAAGDGVCTFEEACSTSGCVKDAWLAHDLGEPRSISRSRFLSDWWGLRPNNYEIWASDSPSDVPLAGATLVAAGVGAKHPWRCVAGESCTDPDVPDACCPNGRDAPQAPPSTTYPKYDTLDFPTHRARYWFLLVRNTYAQRALIMQEVEYWGTR